MTTMGGPTRSVAELTAADIMTAPAVACREEAYFEEVAELLADREISGLPVVDAASRVVGVVSERDLAHALGGPLIRLVLRRPVHSGPFPRSRSHAVPIGAKRVSDVMTSPAIVVDPEMPLRELAQTMLEQQINRIPIVHLGRLVGLVTRGDLLGAIAGTHREIALGQPPVVIGSGVLDGMFAIDTGRAEKRREEHRY